MTRKSLRQIDSGTRGRRVICLCGWTREGEMVSVNRQFKIHRRYCHHQTTECGIPEFNKSIADQNRDIRAKGNTSLVICQTPDRRIHKVHLNELFHHQQEIRSQTS